MGRRLLLKQSFILPMTESFFFSKQQCKLVLVLNLFQPPKLQIRIPSVGRHRGLGQRKRPGLRSLKRNTTQVSAGLSQFCSSGMEEEGRGQRLAPYTHPLFSFIGQVYFFETNQKAEKNTDFDSELSHSWIDVFSLSPT